jgi:hypothetical protein
MYKCPCSGLSSLSLSSYSFSAVAATTGVANLMNKDQREKFDQALEWLNCSEDEDYREAARDYIRDQRLHGLNAEIRDKANDICNRYDI